jgi:uncharacterized membrane protein
MLTSLTQAIWHRQSWPSLSGIGIGIIAAGLLIVMPIVKFENLHSNFYDLGQYATYHYTIAFSGCWSSLLHTHAHLLAAPYVLAYKFFPSNLTLIVLQSSVVVLTTGLFTVYWLRLKLPMPAAGALLYLLSISTWFAALFEFHFEHLIFPLIFGFFLIIELSNRLWAQLLAVLLGLLLCFVKEMYPLSAAMLGIYLIIGKRWLAAGIALLLLSLIYFFVITLVAIPYFSNGAETGELWNSGFGHLGTSAMDILENVAKHPWALLSEILATPRKLLYVFVLFGALAFLPLYRPIALLPALPIIGISLVSHNVNHYYLGHQYTVAVVATLLVAAAQALLTLSRAIQIRWIAAMLLTTVASQIAFGPSPISRLFWSPNIFIYHWTAYRLDDHDRQLKKAIEELIPDDDRIAVSMQNAINADRLTNRSLAFPFPRGVFTPAITENQSGRDSGALPRMASAEFVVLDRQRPLSLSDEICTYDRKFICQDVAFVARFNEMLKRMEQDFAIVYDHDGVVIAQRR